MPAVPFLFVVEVGECAKVRSWGGVEFGRSREHGPATVVVRRPVRVVEAEKAVFGLERGSMLVDASGGVIP